MAIAGRVAIVPKGDWSADATYKRLDAATYNNTLYFAKKEVPAGTATSNTEYWSKSIVGGAGAIATKEDAGIVKPTDGLSIAEDGTLKVNIDGATLTMDQVNNVIKLSDTLKDKINGAFPAANLINNLTTTEAGFGLDARQGKALDDKITEINGSLENYITARQGYFGTSGTSSSWIQASDYPQKYQYAYKFPDVDGYKFLIGFTNIGWTNSDKYYDYMLRNYILNTQSDKVEMYSGQGTPDCVMYFLGLYIKS